MSAVDPERAFALDPTLIRLRQEVVRTRAFLRDLLDQRSIQPVHVNAAREQSRLALERFVAELTQRSLPVPPRIHAELQLIRSLCGKGGDRR